MRDALIIFLILIAAVSLGGVLYLFGGPSFNDPVVTKAPSGIPLTLLAEGSNAVSMDTQVNYRITNQEDLGLLWQMVYSDTGNSAPLVDFSNQEVIAVFDGTHTSGGYSVKVTDVTDSGTKRVIHILRTSPGEGCSTTTAITSPFEILSLPKSDLSLTHIDEFATSTCVQ